ncbi:hypothetical protein [Nonomuraea sp. NPDC049607]
MIAPGRGTDDVLAVVRAWCGRGVGRSTLYQALEGDEPLAAP